MAFRRRYGYRRRRRFNRGTRLSDGRYYRAPRVVYVKPRRRRRRTGKKMKAKPKISRFALAQANPFHSDAYGAKIPDANSVPSCAFQTSNTLPLNTGGTATQARAFRTALINEHVTTASSASAGTWTWSAAFAGGSDNAKAASIASNFNVVRVVAQGVRLTCPLSPNTVTGNVHVCVYTPSYFNKTTWDFPVSVDEMSQQPTYKRFPIATICSKACTIINRTVDFSSERYFDPTSDVAATGTDLSFQTSGWGVILVAVDGAPASTNNVIMAEMVTHFEGVPKTGGLATATPAANYSPSEIGRVSQAVNDADAIPITDANENAVIQSRGFFDGMYDQLSEMGYQGGRAAAYYGAQAAFSGAAGLWQGNSNAIVGRQI